jgi:undecaprenyl-diphosphatase
MSETLLAWDYQILYFVNVTLADPSLDTFWRVFTDIHKLAAFRYGILPLLIAGLLYIYRWRMVKATVALTLGVAAADGLCYRVFKQTFKRARPFDNPDIAEWLRKVGEAHGYGFPSNHAANIFAGSVIMAWFFPAGRWFFYIFAFFIALSRSVLGVHYPSDIFVGALLGICVGFLVRKLLLERVRWFRRPKDVSDSDSVSSASSA